MKTLGIISEYNPFHNGHKYHIQAARDEFDADSIVSIMSGSFVQRGEAAIFDKWCRAEMALRGGADLVIELPFVYSCQPAEIFSFGAINILNNLGIIDGICFGSELGSSDALIEIAKLLIDEPAEFSQLVKLYLSKGNTYPKSISLALGDYYKGNETINADIWENPNNVLGIEYIKSIIMLRSPMLPYTIKRVSNQHNDVVITQPIASATAVRQELKGFGMSDTLKMALPSTSYDVIKSNIEAGKGPILLDAYSDMLLYRLRTMTVEQIGEYMSINEGLEYRIKKAAAKSTCIDELIDAIKTKRYTRAFIQRLLCHVLIDVKWAESYSFKQAGTPSYCRVLGFNDKGKQLLKKINDTSEYPVINKVAAFKSEDPTLNKIFKYDLMSTDIYNLAYTNKSYKRAGEDYIKSPVYI